MIGSDHNSQELSKA